MYADIFFDPFGYKQKQIAGFINFSIFIDTPLDIALARRIIRDFENEPTESIINDMKGYLERGQSVYIQTQRFSKEDSDLVIDGSLPINQIVDIIMKKIKRL
jgi:uridine kinase